MIGGRRPKPTAIKIAEGDRGKGRRPMNLREPKPAPFDAEPPEFLDEEARKAWFHFVPILQEMRVLTAADTQALVGLCEVHSAWLRALCELETEGDTFVSDRGGMVANPLVAIVEQRRRARLEHLREFGLTPSSRTRVQTQAEKIEEPILATLCG